MKKVLIYSLKDPISNQIRYIGKTEESLEVRLYRHLKKKGTTHTISWIKSLFEKGHKPIIELIEESNINTWQNIEKYWIEQFKVWGFNLTNHEPGGLGRTKGFKHSEETKNKMSSTRKGKLPKNITKESIIKLQKFNELRKIPVIAIYPNGDKISYSSIKEASKITNINTTSIERCVKGVIKKTKTNFKFLKN